MKDGAISFTRIVKGAQVKVAPVLVAVTVYSVAAWIVVGVPVILPVVGVNSKPVGSGGVGEIVYVIMPVPVVTFGIRVKTLSTVPIEEEE